MTLINPNIQESDKFDIKDDLFLDFNSIKGGDIRHDWSLEEVKEIHELPLMDLLWRAQIVHRSYNPGYKVQLASLLSVKTGGCSEDCSYCPQSVHNETRVQPFPGRLRQGRRKVQVCSNQPFTPSKLTARSSGLIGRGKY